MKKSLFIAKVLSKLTILRRGQSISRIFTVFIISGIATILLINTVGWKLEKLNTKVYQIISGKKPQHFTYDENGIPVVVYEGKIGKQYNAVAVAEFAIKMSEAMDSSGIVGFNNSIQWLISNSSKLNDSSIVFYYHYDWPVYQMCNPWRSAMSQGRATQAFIKAFDKTGDSIYLRYAKMSINTLFTPVADGGVSYIDSSGYWFEEYADENAIQSRVLNGMIVVLESLSDFYTITKDPGSLFLFSQGVNSLKKTIHLYDNSGYTYYDILKKPANIWYHKFHIELVDFLYQQTNDPLFNEYRLKWAKYKYPSYLHTLINKPTNIAIFTVFSLFFVFVLIFSSIDILLFLRKK